MFHLSTKSRYGLRTLVQLASTGKDAPVSLNELAKGQKISKKYLENIYRMLQKNGIVRSVRGARGGYQLAADPATLTVKEIMSSIEGPVCLIDCLCDENWCKNVKNCSTRWIWSDLQDVIRAFLEAKTLADVIEASKRQDHNFTGMYI